MAMFNSKVIGRLPEGWTSHIGAQGKAVHAIIMLLGVGLFTVPMGLFASAFRERVSVFRRAVTDGMDRRQKWAFGMK